jgi:membrane-bound serine protease (ClpP class)
MQRVVLVMGALALAIVAADASHAAGGVVSLRLEDTVQPASQAFLTRALDRAEELDAALVVVELDTPGGLLDSTRGMTTAMTGCSVPVAVYVAPAGARAASAGFFLLMAADVAAMAPGTNTGAAHPVSSFGEAPEEMLDKATNDAAAMIRSFAEQRGRNVDLAVTAVTESQSFTAEEALRDNLIDLVAGSFGELLEELDGREVVRMDGSSVQLELAGAQVTRVEPTAKERLLSLLANPNLAFILFVLAGFGIYTELTNPGGILPGVVGVVALLLFLYATQVLPVNLLGVGLIVVAVVMLVLEVKVASYGLLTAGGVTAFVFGALLLFDTPIPAMRVDLWLVLPTALFLAVAVGFLLQRVIAAHRERPSTGSDGLVGEIGEVRGVAGSTCTVLVHGEYWRARSPSRPVSEGVAVRVTGVEGMTLFVEPVE